MFARCGGVALYARERLFGAGEDPSPTFSAIEVQAEEPALSRAPTRFGLCESVCARARCHAQRRATSVAPGTTTRERSPRARRASLMRAARPASNPFRCTELTVCSLA